MIRAKVFRLRPPTLSESLHWGFVIYDSDQPVAQIITRGTRPTWDQAFRAACLKLRIEYPPNP